MRLTEANSSPGLRRWTTTTIRRKGNPGVDDQRHRPEPRHVDPAELDVAHAGQARSVVADVGQRRRGVSAETSIRIDICRGHRRAGASFRCRRSGTGTTPRRPRVIRRRRDQRHEAGRARRVVAGRTGCAAATGPSSARAARRRPATSPPRRRPTTRHAAPSLVRPMAPSLSLSCRPLGRASRDDHASPAIHASRRAPATHPGTWPGPRCSTFARSVRDRGHRGGRAGGDDRHGPPGRPRGGPRLGRARRGIGRHDRDRRRLVHVVVRPRDGPARDRRRQLAMFGGRAIPIDFEFHPFELMWFTTALMLVVDANGFFWHSSPTATRARSAASTPATTARRAPCTSRSRSARTRCGTTRCTRGSRCRWGSACSWSRPAATRCSRSAMPRPSTCSASRSRTAVSARRAR